MAGGTGAGRGTDTLFVNGRLFTAGWPSSRPGALAVTGGRIVAVGDPDDVVSLAGPRTEIVDLDGGLLTPGFQDAHVHPVMAGVHMLQCDLHDAVSAEDCLARVAMYALQHPDEPWVVGGGWSMEFFPGGLPTRHLLDAVVPDRPVSLANRDGHGSWVNSLALRLAGVDAATPDPEDGRIERESDGRPSGALHEGAVDLVDRLLPPLTRAQQYAGLLEAQRVLFSVGVTSWQDAAVGAMFGLDDVQLVYEQAAAAGELLARVVGALWWERDRGAEQIADLVERRGGAVPADGPEWFGSRRFRPTAVKIMQDGIAENFTAAMTEPYLDACGCASGNAGISFVDPALLCEYVTRLDAEGFQVHVHALGDRAVRESLDALEAAIAVNGRRDHRHQLAHLQVVHPDDIPRFGRLGATANIQPLWAAHEPQMDELTIPFLGEPRASWQYPFADLARAGAAVAAGSDWPVTRPDPLWGMHVAVNRASPGAIGTAAEPLYGHNRLSLAESMSAYTAGSARANHQDRWTGRLVEGMAADLVVLDRDPFTGPPEAIADATVTRTYIDGAIVHRAADA